MRSPSVIRRCWWAFAAVAIVCHLPARAAAGCGGHSAGFYTQVEAESSSDAAQDVPVSPEPPQGPNCSRAPLRDGLPPAPATTPVVPVKGQGSCLASAGDDPHRAFDPDRRSPRPTRLAASIFHPPRAG